MIAHGLHPASYNYMYNHGCKLALSPGHSQFTLKNWEWPGDEARCKPNWGVTNREHIISVFQYNAHMSSIYNESSGSMQLDSILA